MKDKPGIKRFLIGAVFILLWSSWIQSTFKFVKEKHLHGDVKEVADVTFDFPLWFSGEFQEKKEDFLNNNFGFRNTCIRINNQIDFSLFNKINAKEIVVGKENTLYEVSYINNYLGKDFKGDQMHLERLQKLQSLSDTLSKLNKTLLVVIAPGKGSFFSEFIPDELNTGKSRNNYESFIEQSKNFPNLNLIDFSALFNRIKTKTPYHLFPKFGIHWAPYGVEICADSILNTIETKRSIKLRRLKMSSIELKEAEGVDFDIGDGMNLLFRPGTDILEYPVHEYLRPEGFVRPKITVISDSFYWNLYERFKYSFEENTFWYYYRDLKYINQGNAPTPTADEIRNQVANSDIIMILTNESQTKDLGWGFVESCYQVFFNK